MIDAVIVHKIPGRIRLRLAGKRGDTGYFSRLTDSLHAIQGVQGVTANALTGSVVVQFAQDWERICEQLHEHGLDLAAARARRCAACGRSGW